MRVYALSAALLATAFTATASTAPPDAAGAAVDQTPPPSINGITADGDTLWVASIAGDEVLRIDATTGDILERYAADGATPDDVAIGPDGAVYTTGMGNGAVGRIADGEYRVVATLQPGINPLEFSPSGELYVGMLNPDGTLWRVPLDGSEPEIVAEHLPSINGFAVTDTAVVAPAGAFEPGSVIAIDTTTGEVTTIADTFPTETDGPTHLLASATDTDGVYFALDNLTGELFLVDLETGEVTLASTLGGEQVWDNLTFGDGGATYGNVYFSNFTTPTITALGPDAAETVITVGDPALIAPPTTA